MKRYGLRTLRATGVWALIGVVALLLGIWFQPSYQSLCDAMLEGTAPTPCDPVSKTAMASYFLIFLGVISLVVAPIVLSLLAEMRSEGDTRIPAWRAMRYGLLVGALYIVAGVALYVLFV